MRYLQFELLVWVIISLSSVSDTTKEKELKLKMEEPKDIAGVYVCDGVDTTDSKYKGHTIIRKVGAHYLVTWVMSASTYSGVGVKLDDVLSVSWALETTKGVITGVNVYKMQNNRMEGKWGTWPGPGKLGRETLTLIRRGVDDDED